MRAELKSMMSPDVADLPNWNPDPEFSVFIQLSIGPAGERGEELFGITVCSPSGLEVTLQQHDVLGGRALAFMTDYNYASLRSWLERQIAEASGDSWEELAVQLSRFAAWEFDDYQNAYEGKPPRKGFEQRNS
jgi:hypothetical protein